MKLDLSDIQGNVLRGYNLPFARFVFLNFGQAEQARTLLSRLAPLITNATIWDGDKPSKTLNLAISRSALTALELPIGVINTFPIEFLDGMARRRDVLGDTGPSDPSHWDPIWRGRVDVWLAINALSDEDRETAFRDVMGLVADSQGAVLLGWQDAGALVIDGRPAPKEHFGYTDGMSQPDFVGGQAIDIPGDGKLGRHGRWDEIETGEFILGHPNEAGELPLAPSPPVLSKNGTYLVYRKLEQDVRAFRTYVSEQGTRYPGGPEKLMAKFVGRWRDGTPLALSPDKMDPSITSDPNRSNNFTYGDDPQGLKCPIGAHIRRANPRDSNGFNGYLATRRRIVRRGLPYGSYVPEGAEIDDQERGVIFMALNASLSRQFEFVQQQWINYGNDFKLGEDRDPLAGGNDSKGRFVIPGDAGKQEDPFICSQLPSFVKLRGGEYFFVPSLTALRLLAANSIDPR